MKCICLICQKYEKNCDICETQLICAKNDKDDNGLISKFVTFDNEGWTLYFCQKCYNNDDGIILIPQLDIKTF